MKFPLLLLLASAYVLAHVPGDPVGRAFRPGESQSPATSIELRDGMTVRGKYVTVLVGSHQQQVAPGGVVTLMVRVTPGPKMHLYAPGQAGYTPVALTVQKDAAYRARPVVYPASTLFEFVPLAEKVKVYDTPFTLRQDLVLATTTGLKRRAAAGETLLVKGTLVYQACDDTICYRPETLAVEWRIKLVSADPGQPVD